MNYAPCSVVGRIGCFQTNTQKLQSQFQTKSQKPAFYQLKTFLVMINNATKWCLCWPFILYPAGICCWLLVSDEESTVSERTSLYPAYFPDHLLATKTETSLYKNFGWRNSFCKENSHHLTTYWSVKSRTNEKTPPNTASFCFSYRGTWDRQMNRTNIWYFKE